MKQESMKKTRLTKKDREVYLRGLKKYHDRGVSIIIDGQVSDYNDFGKILEVRENSFYMGDYISDVNTGRLMEIRFDRISTK